MSTRLAGADVEISVDDGAGYTSAYTMAFWARRADATSLVAVYGAAGDWAYSDQLMNGELYTWGATEDGAGDYMPAALVGVWHYFSLVRTDDETLTVYRDATLLDTVTNGERIAAAEQTYCSGANGADVAYWRVWSAALSPAELTAERASPTPVRTADLWAHWPLTVHTDLTDASGNGRHLSATGTLETASNPPVDEPEPEPEPGDPEPRTLVVEAEDRTFDVQADDNIFEVEAEDRTLQTGVGSMAGFWRKDPDATLDYTVNWAPWLTDGDAIDSVAWEVPAGLTLVSSSNTTTKATAFLSGGELGERYRVVCRVTTTGGRIDDRTVQLRIAQR